MAGTTTASRPTTMAGSDMHALKINNNLIVDDLETLRASASAGGVVAVTELMADHATFKVTVDQLETLAEELGADHATFKTVVDELKTDYTALLADVTAIRTAVLAITAKLDADAGVTDTNYAATTNPAALTATAIAASTPATLAASIAITSGPATLTASVPTGTSIDTAADLLSYKIGDLSGTAVTV